MVTRTKAALRCIQFTVVYATIPFAAFVQIVADVFEGILISWDTVKEDVSEAHHFYKVGMSRYLVILFRGH